MPNDAIQVQLVHEPKDWKDDVKFGVEIAGPIVAAFFGYLILRVTNKLQKSQWRSQKVIEKRISEWDNLRSDLNDIFCFCTRVGGWKAMTPLDAIARKRSADKKMHLARPYFSERFFSLYLVFIKTCFAQFQGHAVDAKIRSPLWEHKNARQLTWDPAWDELFFDQPSTEDQLWAAYDSLLVTVSEELETRHD
jgi:hypothetical protein